MANMTDDEERVRVKTMVTPSTLSHLPGCVFVQLHRPKKSSNLRVLPPLVMHLVLMSRLLIVWIDRPRIEHFGLVQKLVVEAEGLLLLAKQWTIRRWCHPTAVSLASPRSAVKT